MRDQAQLGARPTGDVAAHPHSGRPHGAVAGHPADRPATGAASEAQQHGLGLVVEVWPSSTGRPARAASRAA
ncbi:hypothetical protein GS582_34815 [Rhodococcus hoagii]|nr:hypothetical protein [Prescottella equi]